MAETVVWVSQHTPTLRQREELSRLFPNHRLIIDPRSFSGVDEIIQRYREVGGTQMVVVAPLSVVHKLVERGMRPIWSQMKQVPLFSPDAEVLTKGRAYRFIKFKRISAYNLELEEIEPPTPTEPEQGE